MTLQDLLAGRMPGWRKHDKGSAAFYTTVSLSRNLKGFPFPNRSDEKNRITSAEKVEDIVDALNRAGGNFHEYSLSALDEGERKILKETGYVPEDAVAFNGETRLYMNDDGSAAITANVGDHVVFHAFSGGKGAVSLWKTLSDMEAAAAKAYPFAFDQEFGYLTSSPEITGTGLKMSALLFLPGFAIHNETKKLADQVARYGFTLTPLAGREDTKYPFYDLTSARTLGVNEEEYVADFAEILRQISNKENRLWKDTFGSSADVIRDRVWRALGTLKYARRIGREEALELAGLMEMGIREDMLPDPTGQLFDTLFSLVSDSQVASAAQKNGIGEDEAKVWRAVLLREAVKDL